MVDVFEDFEEGDYIYSFVVGGGDGELFDGGVEVVEFWRREGRVVALVFFCHGEDGRSRVDGGYGVGGGEAGGGLGEDAAAAADIEVFQPFLVGVLAERDDGGEAGADEGVSVRVHEVQESRRTVGIPPGRGEAGEVRNLGGGDGGLRGAILGTERTRREMLGRGRN